MNKKKSASWVTELSNVIEEERNDQHPGDDWLTKEEIRNHLAEGMPNDPITDYKLKGFLATLRARGRVEVTTRYIPSDTGFRRRQVFYKLKK